MQRVAMIGASIYEHMMAITAKNIFEGENVNL